MGEEWEVYAGDLVSGWVVLGKVTMPLASPMRGAGLVFGQIRLRFVEYQRFGEDKFAYWIHLFA